MSTSLIAKWKAAVSGSEKLAADLKAANDEITHTTAELTKVTGERDTHALKVGELTAANAALQQQVAALTASQKDFEGKVGAEVADRMAKLGAPAAALPAPASAEELTADTEAEMLAAISAEKDLAKKSALYQKYAAKFWDNKK